jgi:PAS domain S-box-containing protein
MHLLLYLSAFQSFAGALLAVLSRRRYQRLPREFARSWWSYYWTCTSIVYAGLAAHLYHEIEAGVSAPLALFLTGVAAICAPGFVVMAAWFLNAPPAVRPPVAGGIAVSLAAAAAYFVARSLPAQPDRAFPLAPAILLNAAGVAWFSFSLGTRLGRNSRWPERFVLFGSLAWSIHLLITGLSVFGLPLSYGSASVYQAVAASAVFVCIGTGMVLSIAEGGVSAQVRFEAMWAAANDCMRLTDQDGTILLANPAYCRMAGKPREDLEGQSLASVYAEGWREAALREYRDNFRSGTLPRLREREVHFWDGRRAWFEATTATVRSPRGEAFLSVFRDVTERKLAEVALQRRERQLEILCRAARDINSTLESVAVLRSVVFAALKLTGASSGASGLACGERVVLSEFHENGKTVRISALPCDDTVPDGTPRPPEPWVTNHFSSGSEAAFPQGPNLQNRARIPVVGISGNLLASFEVYNTTDSRPFDDQDVLMLEGLAASAAIALENAAIFAERRRAEDRLALSERRYRSVVDGSPMGMHFYSLAPGGGLIFEGANPAAEAILGMDHQPLIGAPIGQAFPSLAATGIAGRYRKVIETGEPWSSEHVEYQDNHITAAYEVQAFPTGPSALAVTFDRITDRKQAQEALRASEERYRLITENSTDTISTLTSEGICTFVSPACRRLMGLEPEEIRGKSWYDFIHPEDAQLFRRAHDSLTGTSQQIASYRLACKDKGWTLAETTARLIYDPVTGENRGIVAVTRDIAERRELEEQFRQAQKLESVGRLAGGVAHDFNNILTVINGYSAMMAAELDKADPLLDSVVEIMTAGERAAALTHQLLAFSRKQVLLPRLLDLNESISEAERMLRRVIGEDIDFRIVLGPGLGQVKADPTQIQQVLLNLVVNARDAMPSGGRLTIETANVDLDVGCAEWQPEMIAGPYVRLALSDTGTGMDEETRSHVFEPFFTTKDASRGTGLGLSTVFGIVKQSGGHIRLESELGSGAAFKIYLPRIADTDVRPAQREESPASRRGWETVLVVEDQVEVRRLASRVLTGQGYRVLDAGEAYEALSICARYPDPIHLTVTDVILPGMTGLDLARRLKQVRPEMKILYMSGYTDNVVVTQNAIENGRNYLQKPFTPEALLNRVRELLGEPLAKGKVLLVDDETGVRKVLRKVLESAGYTVCEAGNGSEALARVRQGSVDLILTDLVMPEKAGLETIRELRTQYPALRVVAMSGVFEGRYLKTAALIGARATVKKPVAPDELLRIVEKVMLAPA